MDKLLKQTRLKYSGVGQEKAEGTSNIRDRKIPAQKTPSFKGDKKSQSWLQRQFSKQMSRSDGYGGEDELAAAVAAAALAVDKLDDSTTPDRSQTSAGPERTSTKAKSKRKNASTHLETGEESLKNPDRKIPITGPAEPVRKRPSFDELLEGTEDAKGGAPAPPKPSPSIEKASSSADKQFKKISMKSAPIPGGESKADAWIREESARIKERYDNLNSTIAEWETKKKKKARHKLTVTESELEKKRAKALQTFRAEMESIEQIAAGARAQAEERQKNEELKAKDKANRIRTTGKLPATCVCF